MIAIDKLCYHSKLRYVNAGEKMVYGIATLLLCVCSRSFLLAVAVLIVNGYLLVKKSGVLWKRYLYFMMVPMAFIFLSTFAIIINFSKTPLNAFAIKIMDFYVTGSYEGIYFGLQLIATALASVSCLYFISFTTPMPDILNVLRKAKCPGLIIELMMLIYRYIFVLLEIANHIIISQNSRLGNRDYKTSMKSFGQMGSVLFVRSIKKSNALYDAIESRGYDGVIRVLNESYPPSNKEIIWIMVAEIFYIFLIVIQK